MTLPLPDAFAPYADLARQLIPHATDSNDGSHDIAHILRVFKNAMRIHATEGGDGVILTAAVLLHDCVAVEKNSPLRSQASRLAAEKSSGILTSMGWEKAAIEAVAHAITTALLHKSVFGRNSCRFVLCHDMRTVTGVPILANLLRMAAPILISVT